MVLLNIMQRSYTLIIKPLGPLAQRSRRQASYMESIVSRSVEIQLKPLEVFVDIFLTLNKKHHPNMSWLQSVLIYRK